MPPLTPHMPEVDSHPELAPVFARAHEISSGAIATPGRRIGDRCVVIVTPGRLIMHVTCPPAKSVTPAMLEDVRGIMPEHPKRRIVVIASNSLPKKKTNASMEVVKKFIPFIGYLVGMAFDGHTVVVFEGHPSAMQGACEGASALLVDEGMIPHLQQDWATIAASVMEKPAMLIFHRNGTLSRVDQRGNVKRVVPGEIEHKKWWWWPFNRGA